MQLLREAFSKLPQSITAPTRLRFNATTNADELLTTFVRAAAFISLRLSTGGSSLTHVNSASSLYDCSQSGQLNHILSNRAVGDVTHERISAGFSLLQQWLHISGDTRFISSTRFWTNCFQSPLSPQIQCKETLGSFLAPGVRNLNEVG